MWQNHLAPPTQVSGLGSEKFTLPACEVECSKRVNQHISSILSIVTGVADKVLSVS